MRTDRGMRLLTHQRLWIALFNQRADRFRAVGPSSVLYADNRRLRTRCIVPSGLRLVQSTK